MDESEINGMDDSFYHNPSGAQDGFGHQGLLRNNNLSQKQFKRPYSPPLKQMITTDDMN